MVVTHQADPQITDRQREVLVLVCDGLTNAQIAERLGIATRTVKAHSDALRQKLGVEHKRDLILRARELALV